ncbi:MAG: YbfB/YjiJ family MFS transporter [Acidimicrobiia bacterium]
MNAAGLLVAVGFGRFTYGLLLPAMTTGVVGSYGRAGLLGTVNLGAYLVGMLAIGTLTGRVYPERLLAAGIMGSVLGMAGLSVDLGRLIGCAVWHPFEWNGDRGSRLCE